MTELQALLSQVWVERLGWTLIHFLWQGLAIAAVYAAARRFLLRTTNPETRYLLACTALTAMVTVSLLTYVVIMRPGASSIAISRILNARPTGSLAAAPIALPASVRAVVSDAHEPSFLPWVVIVWFVGAAGLWVRLIGGWIVASRMRWASGRVAGPEWQQLLAQLGTAIGLSRPVRLLVSALIEVPTVVGWLRPVVLVPVGALDGLPSGYLRALLVHELAHIRRYDNLVNLCQSVVEALLFYHPAVWWVSGHMRTERELCADDVAVSAVGDRLMYARALADLEAFRPAHVEAAVAANGGALAHRIARLIGHSRPVDRSAFGPGALVIAVLLAATAYGLLGQASDPPSFETISIKRNTSPWSERFDHPMGLRNNASLLLLIQFAYASHDNPMSGHVLPLPASQVVGGPGWKDSEGYDIQTRSRTNAGPEMEWRSWQTLLADRFKLRLHREVRELPGYVLSVAQGGLKLPSPMPGVECLSFPPGTPPRHIPGKVDCGYVSGPIGDSGGLRIAGTKIRMEDLRKELALILDAPVFDETGFRGDFDLSLSFGPDETLHGVPAAALSTAAGSRDSNRANLPNIIAALDAQLGLKLAPARGPVEVLVIDSAERPVEN